MAHEVVVVGGGIGGLTVAALLAARGVDVCLLEREPQVGGCVASFEKFGYTFEPTLGLYSCWNPEEIHQRIFAELPVEPPETRALNPAYVVRLPDDAEIALDADTTRFEKDLQKIFPECASATLTFYRESMKASDALLQALRRVPDLRTASRARRLSAFLPKVASANQLLTQKSGTVSQHLQETSARFQRFVDIQLRAFANTSLDECSYPAACVALNLPRRKLFAILGGAATLAQRLADSIKSSGGRVRLDSPVLRLSYDSNGQATGVDLLSGENITATKAIVSNMTAWDTYGKLIGLQRTSAELKQRLATLKSRGAYVIFAGMDGEVASRLQADRLLVASTSRAESESMIDACGFAFSAAPSWDPRAPAGKRSVSIIFSTDVDQWFTYHSDATEQEAKDEAALEIAWQTVHAAVPELGDGIEVIDTATPLTYYETTRRKLGMVGGLGQSSEVFGLASISHRTILPNVFMVGDTTFPGPGLAAVSHAALTLVNEITD